MWPALIGAASSLIGGLFNRNAQEKQQEQSWWNAIAANQEKERQEALNINRDIQARRDTELNNARILHERQVDRDMQREFATSGIRMRVADAVKAGIHPIFALGGSGATYSPSPISLDTPRIAAPTSSMALPGTGPGGMGSTVSNMGQDISRALMATRTASGRDEAFNQTVQEMQLQNFTLRNELLAAQIQKLKANQNPAMPESTSDTVPLSDTFEDRPRLRPWGETFRSDPSVTNTEDAEKRYGELTDWVVGPYVLWRDYNHNQALNPRASGPNMSWMADFGAAHERMAARRRYQGSSNWKGHF